MIPNTASAATPDADHHLIRGVVDGQHFAAERLFRRHAAAMFSLACRISRDPTLAEDAVQDASLQVWRNADQYDPARGTVLSWLLIITRGRTLDRLRARQLRHEHVRQGFDADTASSPQCPIDDVFDHRERLAMIDAVLEVLPGPDRRAVELAYHQGLTHTEIAERLHVPLGTAKTQLRRAMQVLRTAVTDGPRRPFQWRRPETVPVPVSRLANLKILVVDDEPDTVKLTTLVLTRAGAAVGVAASAAQAMNRLEAYWPDAVLIDLSMPDVDGYTLIGWLRSLCRQYGRRLPAIAFTAHGADADRRRCRSAGFDLHLTKPIRPAALVSAVATLVGT